jgi:hypothetical protein
MKLLRLILFLCFLSVTVVYANPDRLVAVRSARAVLEKPDEWHDMRDELKFLGDVGQNLPEKEKNALEVFRARLEVQKSYFGTRKFTLSSGERKELLTVLRSYEECFHAERRRIEASLKEKRGEQFGYTPDVGSQARTEAERDIDRLGPVFSRHNWMRDRPNDLAAAYIGVLRAYGELLAAFIETPPLGNWRTPYQGIF